METAAEVEADSLDWMFATVERRAGTESASVTPAPPVTEPYDMDAAPMSLELHERGSHVVWTGVPGWWAGIRRHERVPTTDGCVLPGCLGPERPL